ncbi:hypothetical protein [Mycobacteroides abscessus]|uniref:hypothetical protein n=1 Tax=Mycobacteroides abscessus TaxID=36809 RepID=UPI0018E43A41|nr:hypothetical protein [Mycobacteroides abscessus]
MNTTVDEIADGIFRFSTWSPRPSPSSHRSEFLVSHGFSGNLTCDTAGFDALDILRTPAAVSYHSTHPSQLGGRAVVRRNHRNAAVRDLYTRTGQVPELTEPYCVAPALAAKGLFHAA